MSSALDPICLRCGDPLPAEAHFCPRCGERVPTPRTEPVRRETSVEFPPRLHHVERRPLGLPSLPFLAAITLVLAVVAIALLASASWLGGVLALLAVIGFGALLAAGIRQEPDSATAQMARRATSRVRGSSGFAAAASRAWLHAMTELIRIRGRRVRLQRQLHSQLAPLGEAVHNEDETKAQALKAKAAELQRALELAEQRETAVRGAARERIQRERVPMQSTEVLEVVPEPPTDEHDSTASAHEGRLSA